MIVIFIAAYIYIKKGNTILRLFFPIEQMFDENRYVINSNIILYKTSGTTYTIWDADGMGIINGFIKSMYFNEKMRTIYLAYSPMDYNRDDTNMLYAIIEYSNSGINTIKTNLQSNTIICSDKIKYYWAKNWIYWLRENNNENADVFSINAGLCCQFIKIGQRIVQII